MDGVVRADRALVDGQIRAAAVGVVDGVIVAVGPLDSDVTAHEDVRVPPSQS
jgi:allantoinase